MNDFVTMDNAVHSAKSPTEKVGIFRQLVIKAQNDVKFRETINIERFWNSNQVLSHLLKKESLSGLKIAVLGYTSQLVGYWDPFDCVKGLPGSEECAVYASQELVKRGHQVTLYMNPPPDSIWRSPFSNPQWLPESAWHFANNKSTYDIVFMWRRYDPDVGRKRGKLIFFWPHDSPYSAQSYSQFPNYDGVFALSKHHHKQLCVFPGFDKVPYVISGNGIVPEQFSQPMSFTNPYSIGYFSNYSRGLNILIFLWPSIKKEFPEATLSICYGRETWNTMSKESFDWLIDKIESYKDLGVTEHGKVGHQELAQIMQNTSVWCYPCTTNAETYCITAIKCQAAGCIPVTTRIGALDETIHPDAPHIPLIQNDKDIQEYKELLFATLRRIESDEIKEERLKYIEFTKNHTWEKCVDKWLELYKSIAN